MLDLLPGHPTASHACFHHMQGTFTVLRLAADGACAAPCRMTEKRHGEYRLSQWMQAAFRIGSPCLLHGRA